MVIAKNKAHGFVQGGIDKIKVIQGQIPRRQNQVYISVPLLDAAAVY